MHCTIILIGEQLTAIGLRGSVFATKYLLTSSKVEYEWVGGSEEGSAKDNAMHEHGRWKKSVKHVLERNSYC